MHIFLHFVFENWCTSAVDFKIFLSVEEENSSRTDYTLLKEALRDQSYGLAVTIEECECLCVLCFVCFSASRVMKTFSDPSPCIPNILIFIDLKKKFLRKEHYLKKQNKREHTKSGELMQGPKASTVNTALELRHLANIPFISCLIFFDSIKGR